MKEETICAIATRTGGAIAIIRVSGPEAITITDCLFHAVSGKSLKDSKANTIHYGTIYSSIDNHTTNGQIINLNRWNSESNRACSDGRVVTEEGKANPQSSNLKAIDDVVVSLWRAPHSYTGEDAVEISCHGSAYIARNILQALIAAGCRQADHGEFTKRAFLNGKMDLSQAEAVADLIAADNKASHDLALSQLKGHFSSELSALREQLLKLTSLLELELDFSDHEDLEFADRTELHNLAVTINDRINSLAKSFETGQAIKQGIPVAIIGKTNVGKSTLLNQLLHEDKAIVSDVDGTTRDSIDGTLDINGITFRFIDTAGIRHTNDKVEKIGIDRTYQQLEKAAVVLWVIDESPTSSEIADITSRLSKTSHRDVQKPVIVVHNKADISPTPLYKDEIAISAKKGEGISNLKNLIYKKADIPEINDDTIIVTNIRHYEALTRAKQGIERVLDGMSSGLSSDLLAEDLRLCLDDLADITGGKITSQETLNNIFSHFCVGK